MKSCHGHPSGRLKMIVPQKMKQSLGGVLHSLVFMFFVWFICLVFFYSYFFRYFMIITKQIFMIIILQFGVDHQKTSLLMFIADSHMIEVWF